MTLDVRGLHYIEIFRQIGEAVPLATSNDEDVEVFVEAYEFEKCMTIKGFVENMMELKTIIEEACGFYILRIIRDLQTVTG